MVEKDGEKKSRSSKSRRPRLPKSYRLQKKIPESTSKGSSRLKKFNCGNLNCTTEKLSSLLMCQKGYASFAFYAIFTLFILAFIYVLWKIVSANTSRSGQSRRPEASPKVSPTTTAPTWSEEDQEELKKFFPTTAPFIPTREKIEPTSNRLNLPEPNIPLKEPNPTTKKLSRPTQSQIFQLGAYLPSLPRLLRGSVYGEDAVTPLYGRGRQNAIIGEDFTPLPATSPYTSRWPHFSNTNWKANQQERQQLWAFNHQQTPWVYQRKKPLQPPLRNSDLSGQFYAGREQYSQENKEFMKSSFGTTKKMPILQHEDEGQKSGWGKEGKHLHTTKKHGDKHNRRQHRSHARKYNPHNKQTNDDKNSRFDPESEQDDTRNAISHSKFNDEQHQTQNGYKQHTSLSKKHHRMTFADDERGGEMFDGNDMNDIENDDDNDRDVTIRHHHYHHDRRHKQQEHPYHHQHDHHLPPKQQPHHQKQHQLHRHRHHHQQQSQDEEQEEKEVHHIHPHHHSHHHHHHHHNYHARVKYPSSKHFNHKHDLNEEDSQTQHIRKTVHHHSSINTEQAKRTKHIQHPKHHDDDDHHSHHPHHHQHHHHRHYQQEQYHRPPHHHHHHRHQRHQKQKHQIKNTRSHIKRHHLHPVSRHKSNKHSQTKNPLLKHFHHILDYKHYLRFKESHTLDEEVHGNWKGIRQKTKDCISIRTFSANGKVRLTRTRYRAKYLYTVLVCNVVQVRKRGDSQASDSKYRTAQLCHKLYFVTRSIVKLSLDQASKEGSHLPEFKVEACRPSKEVHFEATNFQGALPPHKDRSERSDIPKHKHETRRVSLHKKSKKRKLVHEHSKSVKHQRNVKHKVKTRKHHKRVNHSKKRKKGKIATKKLVSQKHNKTSKKKTKGNNEEDVFFGKLLNILTIASGNNKTSNSSNNPLVKLKGALQKMKKAKEEKAKQLKKKHKTHSKGKKIHLKGIKMPDVSSPRYIQKLLEKILPSVVNNVKADLQGKNGVTSIENDVKAKANATTTAMPTTTPPTTKPTTSSTTRTTTMPTTITTSTTAKTKATTTSTTTKPTTKPTTKSNGLEDELKDILPLLLKKAQLAKKTTITQKPTTLPTTKPMTLSKTKEIKDLLSRLKLGGIDLGGLADSKPTIEVKATANAIHTTVQQKLNELSEPAGFTESQPTSLLDNMDLKQITNTGRAVSVLGNDPFSKNILCFGDSLTRGYYNHGRSTHPYSIQLSRLINANSQIKYNLVTSGKNGEMTHGSMTKRLPEVLGNSSHFDWIIILAGTNDVAHVKNFGDDDSFMNQLVNVWSPKIFQDIISLHETAYKYGARTVLLTIPESAYEAWPQFRTLWVMRRKINQELRDFARRSQGRTILCDLAIKIPRHSLSPQMQKILWSDHLHLTSFGYDKLAGLIYQCMKSYL